MNPKLFAEALSKFILGIVLVGALIFWPAGTLSFWPGWLLMGVMFVPMFVAGILMFAKNPGLLRERLDAKEKEDEQHRKLHRSRTELAFRMDDPA